MPQAKFYEGKWLFSGGKLAMSDACCCEDTVTPPPDCICGGLPTYCISDVDVTFGGVDTGPDWEVIGIPGVRSALDACYTTFPETDCVSKPTCEGFNATFNLTISGAPVCGGFAWIPFCCPVGENGNQENAYHHIDFSPTVPLFGLADPHWVYRLTLWLYSYDPGPGGGTLLRQQDMWYLAPLTLDGFGRWKNYGAFTLSRISHEVIPNAGTTFKGMCTFPHNINIVAHGVL